MKDLMKREDGRPVNWNEAADKIETWAGKHTARVTKTYRRSDGSLYKLTKKINKDGTTSEKIEYRHQ